MLGIVWIDEDELGQSAGCNFLFTLRDTVKKNSITPLDT